MSYLKQGGHSYLKNLKILENTWNEISVLDYTWTFIKSPFFQVYTWKLKFHVLEYTWFLFQIKKWILESKSKK